jgi:hypothetical protein
MMQPVMVQLSEPDGGALLGLKNAKTLALGSWS